MAFLILGLGAEEPVRIDDVAPIATSFPGFVELMTARGAAVEPHPNPPPPPGEG